MATALIRRSRKLGTIFPICWTSKVAQKLQSIACAVHCKLPLTTPTRCSILRFCYSAESWRRYLANCGRNCIWWVRPHWPRASLAPASRDRWIESNIWCPRLTAAMILSGSAVHVNGLGSRFVSATKRLMAAWRSITHRKTPRLSRCSASSAKNPSTALSHEHEVGVKWKVKRGCRSSD